MTRGVSVIKKKIKAKEQAMKFFNTWSVTMITNGSNKGILFMTQAFEEINQVILVKDEFIDGNQGVENARKFLYIVYGIYTIFGNMLQLAMELSDPSYRQR